VGIARGQREGYGRPSIRGNQMHLGVPSAARLADGLGSVFFRAPVPSGLGPMPEGLPMLMDRAYEGDETRQLVLSLGMIPVVPPKSNRIEPWEYDRALYKKRNEIERLFRRLKGFRRIFSRFEKLDVLFLGFLNFALIVEALR
jgi:transposase